MGIIKDITLTPLRIIPAGPGEVMHALKSNEASFQGFGEAYFSTIRNHGAKGWKKHLRMISNLIVPYGSIRFIFFDDRPGSTSYNELQEIILSKENYQRLTVPPGIWMAFEGQSDEINLVLNISSIIHDITEAENLPLINDIIPFTGFK